MRKHKLVRFQLVLLILVIGMLIWRRGTHTDSSDGVVVFSDLSEGKLYRAALQVERATDIAIDIKAAFETDDIDATLAVYGWILSKEDLNVVWNTDPSTLERDGVLAWKVDTIHVDKGSYDVFFTTFGPTESSRKDSPFLGLKPYWTNHDSEWHLILSEVGAPDDKSASIRRVGVKQEREAGDNVIWTTGPMGNRARKSFLFRAVSPVRLDVYSVGEICADGCDLGRIVDMKTSEPVWLMSWENTSPAGGQDKNRVFNGAVELEAGIYTAIYETDRNHSADRWDANPPLDPDGWGITIATSRLDLISEVDPWRQSEPLVDLTRIGDSAVERSQFSLTETASFIVYALGEISSSGSLYDYAWIENDSSREKLWEMSRSKSRAAGGDGTNRFEMAFLVLNPGSYSLYYRSDESHSFEKWRKDEPRNPERWGVTLFPAEPASFSSEIIQFLEVAGVRAEESPSETVEVAHEAAATTAEQIVRFDEVGNDADLSQPFELDSETSLHIVAQGELSSGGRYDYGWIEQQESGGKVWEMTLHNTTFAGGEDRNRRFEGILILPPGAYVARFISDFSHSYDDFGDGQPKVPKDWGMRIFVVNR